MTKCSYGKDCLSYPIGEAYTKDDVCFACMIEDLDNTFQEGCVR